MYHIPNDKRAKQSCELIYQGLLNCLKKKSFYLITITDLQKESGVARSTFYRLFDNMSDVLYWQCDRCFREALMGVTPSNTPNELELIRQYFSYWMEHSDILNLLIDINRQDIIYACHMNNARLLEQSFGTLPDMDECNAHYFLAIRTGMTISILKAWLDNGKKETPEELHQILIKQLSLLNSIYTP